MKHILITLIAIVLLGCGGAEERKAAYIEKATRSFDAGDYEKARIDIKNAIQIDPKDAAAHFMLANIHEQKKDYRKAFKEYNKAAELGPENTEYLAKLGTYYLLSGDNEKAREIIKKINEIDPASIDKDILNASLLIREKNIDGALSLVIKVLEENPDEIKPMLFLAQLYKKQADYDSALRLFSKASELESNDISIKQNIVSIHMQLKNYDKAENILKEIVSIDPDNYKNHIQLALFYKTTGDAKSGEEVLRDALKLDETSIERNLSLVSYLVETKGITAGEAELKLMIDAAEKKEANGLRLALAKLYHDSKNNEEEIAIYKDIIDSGDSSSIGINARVNLSKVYIGDNKIEEALNVINGALEISPNDPEILLLRSNIALLKNDTERAVMDLRLVIKDKPEEIDAYTLLVDAHLRNNEPEQAKEVLIKAYDNNIYNVQSLLKLADLNVKLKNIEGAEKAIDGVLRLEENNVKALTFKTKVLNTRKDFQHAREMAKQLIDLYPDKVEGYQLIAPSMLNDGQADDLYALIKDGYEKTGRDLRLLEIMVAISSGQKKYDSTINLLKAEIEGRNDEAALYRMLAKVYDASGNTKEAVTNFKKAIDIKNDKPELYGELANIYLRSNDSTAAIDILKQGKTILPNNNRIRMSLASLFEKFNQPDNAIAEYEDLLSIEEGNLIVINNLASMISNHRTDKASINRALELVEKLENNKMPALLDTVGWVYYKSGDYEKARTTLEQVAKKEPDAPVFNYHLGMTYLKLGNKEKAKIYLEKSVKGNAVFDGSADAKKSLNSL